MKIVGKKGKEFLNGGIIYAPYMPLSITVLFESIYNKNRKRLQKLGPKKLKKFLEKYPHRLEYL